VAKAKKKKGKKARKAKRASRPQLARISATRHLKAGGGGDVTFDSAPRGGMTMKLGEETLSPLPKTKHLASGTYSLEWTFVGPSKAEYRVIVTGAKSPTEPIKDKIRDGKLVAFGACGVEV
jgi:hypothetical protein